MTTFSTSQYLELSGPNFSMELEVAITYTFQRGYPATWDEPGECDAVEDVEFDLYRITDKAGRGARIEDVPAWLDDFVRKAIGESELISYAKEDA